MEFDLTQYYIPEGEREAAANVTAAISVSQRAFLDNAYLAKVPVHSVTLRFRVPARLAWLSRGYEQEQGGRQYIGVSAF